MAAFQRATAIASAPAESAPAPASSETWYVATTAGVRVLSLDALEHALASGEVDLTTPVWIPGMAEWETLGSVANLEDGPPLDQGPGVPPYHSGPASVRVEAVAPSASIGPLSEALPDSDPSDPNHALWASIAPRASRPVQSGIWRRIDPLPHGRDPAPPRRALRAIVLAGVVLMLLGAWRILARGSERFEGHDPLSARVATS